MPGIEPGAFHMQSERATTALHPPLVYKMRYITDSLSTVPIGKDYASVLLYFLGICNAFHFMSGNNMKHFFIPVVGTSHQCDVPKSL